MPTYILQKDTVLSNAGDEFKTSYQDSCYINTCHIRTEVFACNHVENNSEWFLLKEEKIKVISIETDGFYAKEPKEFLLRIVTNKEVIHDKLFSLKEAIEKVLNDEELTDKKVYNPLTGNLIQQF